MRKLSKSDFRTIQTPKTSHLEQLQQAEAELRLEATKRSNFIANAAALEFLESIDANGGSISANSFDRELVAELRACGFIQWFGESGLLQGFRITEHGRELLLQQVPKTAQVASEFRRLANRLRNLEFCAAESSGHFERHTADAARTLKQVWPVLSKRFSIAANPFPDDDPRRTPFDDRRLWSLTWTTAAFLLTGKMDFGGVVFQQAEPSEAVAVSVGVADSLREQAKDSAELCDELADILEADSMPVVQPVERESSQAVDRPKKRKRKPRMPLRKVAEHWKEVMASGNRDLIERYLTEGEVELAKKIGTSRNTLRKLEAFQKRGISLREFNRENR